MLLPFWLEGALVIERQISILPFLSFGGLKPGLPGGCIALVLLDVHRSLCVYDLSPGLKSNSDTNQCEISCETIGKTRLRGGK